MTSQSNRSQEQGKVSPVSRRDFMQWSGRIAAGSALAGVAIPHVHAAEDNTIRLALIGCGGRGSGAVVNAFDSPNGPCKLTAMADINAQRLEGSYTALSKRNSDKVEVPPDRRFVGFDAFKKAIDCLRPGVDIAMLTTYPGFRPVHLDYAVSKGVNVFMEKSFAVDPVGVRRVLQAGEEAKKKNLKIAAGLMCRHSVNRQELIKRIRDGQLGPLQVIRAYRMEACGGMSPKKPANLSELLWQIRNRTHIMWVSGSLWMEMDIHQIDEICWLKDAHPISAHGVCGRVAGSTDAGQGHDSFSVEYTFEDGAKAYDVVRYIPGCYPEFATFAHGTKCAAQFSGNVHAGTCHIYKDQRCTPVKVAAKYDRSSGQYLYSQEDRKAGDNITWQAPKEAYSCWQAEWNVFLDSIRNNKPQNEAERAAYSNLTGLMGRAAMHMGRIVTWDEMLKSNFQLCPNIDSMTENSAPPLMPDANGHYPVPIPGKWIEV